MSASEVFSLGRIVITSDALERLDPQDTQTALRRHAGGDWGDVPREDVDQNNAALKDGERLLSAYCDRNGVKFWIITERDRSATTILLPEDY